MKFIQRFWQQQRGSVTVPEALLASTMVASVGAFGIAVAPWDTLLNASPEEIVLQLEQIENANLAFRSRYQVWPHQATGGDSAKAALALMDQSVLNFPYSSLAVRSEQLLPRNDYKMDISSQSLHHKLGQGGQILQYPTQDRYNRAVLQIELQNVPIQLAREVDAQVDGRYDPTSGRVLLNFGDTISAPEAVTMYYHVRQLS